MVMPVFYFVLIALAEVLTVDFDPHWGVLLHSCLLVALLLQGAMTSKIQKRRFLLVMALVPLIRILSTTLPLGGRPLLEWHIVIGNLLFVAIFFTTRAVQLDAKRIGIHLKGWPVQIGLSLFGIPLGYIEYLILRPQPLINSWNTLAFLDAAFVLIIFTGVLEEVIFRGLMQEVTVEMMGFLGIFYSAAVFMVLHVGYKSMADLLFVFGVALLFGLVVAKSHSLLGVSLAHGLINIFLYIIFPLASLGSIHIPGIATRTPAQPGASPVASQPIALSRLVTWTPSLVEVKPGCALITIQNLCACTYPPASFLNRELSLAVPFARFELFPPRTETVIEQYASPINVKTDNNFLFLSLPKPGD